jgi:hypothetical protein
MPKTSYRQVSTPVYVLKASKAYKERNRDKVNDYSKQYYDKNKEEILEKKRQDYRKKKIQNQMNFTNLETQFPVNRPMFV